MRVVKRDAPPEQALQKVEALMRELGISIESNTSLYVNYDGVKLGMHCTGGSDSVQLLPRETDEERLHLWG